MKRSDKVSPNYSIESMQTYKRRAKKKKKKEKKKKKKNQKKAGLCLDSSVLDEPPQ